MGSAYNSFRTGTLGIGPQSGFVIDGIPQVTGFNNVVVPRPADWEGHIHFSGVWRFDDATDLSRSQPIPTSLQSLAGTPSTDPRLRPLFLTFESVPLPDPISALTAAHESALKLGVPIIVAAGDTDMSALKASPLLARLTGLRFELADDRGSSSALQPAP